MTADLHYTQSIQLYTQSTIIIYTEYTIVYTEYTIVYTNSTINNSYTIGFSVVSRVNVHRTAVTTVDI